MPRSHALFGRLAAALLVALLALGAQAPAAALADEVSDAVNDPVYSAEEPPEVASAAAILVEADHGTVLLDKDADARREPASTTKIMTALVTLENAGLDEQVTVEESDFDEVTAESSVAGLVAGETLSVRDLLACLLLPSGNDASYVLARYVGGGDWHAFVDMMNEKATELGCAGTHFANPCGLPDDDHYTTARDLATIMQAAVAYPAFREIAGTATWDLPETSGNPARTLESTNLLVDPESPVYMGEGVVIAGKTGYTDNAGRCLVVCAEKDGMTLVGVTLGASAAPDAQGVSETFYDMRSMLDWGFGAWQVGAVVSPGDALGTADVMLSSDGETVQALSSGGLDTVTPRGTTFSDLTLTPAWEGTDPETGAFMAPIAEGQRLGTVSAALDGRQLGEFSVVAARTMELSIPAYVMWWLSDPVHAVIAVVAVVALFVVIGLVSAIVRGRRRRRASRYQMAVGARPRVRPGAGGQRFDLPEQQRKAGRHAAPGKHARR